MGLDQGDLGGGGAGVDAQVGRTFVICGVHLGGMVGVVPGQEGVVVRLVGKQGCHGVHRGGGVHAAFQLFQHLVKAVAVLGENGVLLVQFQSGNKALPQALQEVQGTTQEDDLALQLTALGQAGHRLVHDRLEDGGGHVLLAPALVQDGLDIALGEHAAAGGDGIDLLMLQGQLIQLINGHIHQRGHLVDKGAGAAGAGAVHALLQRAAEEDDLGVLAAQLDNGVGIRYVLVHSGGGGVHLLHKVQAGHLGHAQARRAGHHQLHLLPGQFFPDGAQRLRRTLTGFGIMPLVRAE